MVKVVKKILNILLIIFCSKNFCYELSQQLIHQTANSIKSLFSKLVTNKKSNRYQQLNVKDRKRALYISALHNLSANLNQSIDLIESDKNFITRHIQQRNKNPLVSIKKEDLVEKYNETMRYVQSDWVPTSDKDWPDHFTKQNLSLDDHIVFGKESDFNLEDTINALFSILEEKFYFQITEKYFIKEEKTIKKKFIILRRDQLFTISKILGFPVPTKCVNNYLRMIKPWLK